MAEAINKYFIINGERRETELFNDNLVKDGKSLYEVIRIIKGVPLFLENHLNRLYNSAKITNLEVGYGIEEIKAVIRKLINCNNDFNGNVKIVFNYKENSAVNNNFLAYFIGHSYPTDEQYKIGVPVILYHGERSNPNAKVINVSFREQVDREIKKKNVYEAILVDRYGNITEGSKSNIFMVKDNEVLTAPIETVLPGITRQTIIDLCEELQIKVSEKKINFSNINDIDGLFISGTSPKVLPINKVDEMNINSSSNKVILSIMEVYDNNIEKYVKAFKEDI